MSSATAFLQADQAGIDKKDSSQAAELITDDFQMKSPIATRSRQEFLDWVAVGGNVATVTAVFDLEVLYENDEIAVVSHSTNSGETYTGKVLCCGRKRDGQFYDWRLGRLGS